MILALIHDTAPMAVMTKPDGSITVDGQAQAGIALLPSCVGTFRADELLIAVGVASGSNAMREKPFGKARHVSSSRPGAAQVRAAPGDRSSALGSTKSAPEGETAARSVGSRREPGTSRRRR